jgi:hypothetical protein
MVCDTRDQTLSGRRSENFRSCFWRLLSEGDRRLLPKFEESRKAEDPKSCWVAKALDPNTAISYHFCFRNSGLQSRLALLFISL